MTERHTGTSSGRRSARSCCSSASSSERPSSATAIRPASTSISTCLGCMISPVNFAPRRTIRSSISTRCTPAIQAPPLLPYSLPPIAPLDPSPAPTPFWVISNRDLSAILSNPSPFQSPVSSPPTPPPKTSEATLSPLPYCFTILAPEGVSPFRLVHNRSPEFNPNKSSSSLYPPTLPLLSCSSSPLRAPRMYSCHRFSFQ